jgi:hypothetical protein
MILIDVKQCTQEQVVAVLVYNNKRSTYLYNCTVGTVTQVDCIVCRRVECLLNESKSNQVSCSTQQFELFLLFYGSPASSSRMYD